jgi:magnesium transporter
MASNRPVPSSRSDPQVAHPSDMRVRRDGIVASADRPGMLRVAAMDGDAIRESDGESALELLTLAVGRTEASVWVDLTNPSPAQARQVGQILRLHPLIVEDVLEGNQRAKIESTGGAVHIVLFHLAYDAEVVATELDVVLGRGFLLTSHSGAWDPRTGHHLASGLAPVLGRGPDHLLWAIADDLIDGYFPFADRIGEAIDEVQDDVIRRASPDTLEQLFTLKRNLIEVRRAISPVRDVFNQLTNRDEALIDPEEVVYFRDIYDHVIRLTDELDNYRELASATLDVYLTQVNNNLSIIMKRLTGVTVILAGIAAVTGIFGMSEAGAVFRGGEAGGFWIVTVCIVGIAVLAAAILRRIDWI